MGDPLKTTPCILSYPALYVARRARNKAGVEIGQPRYGCNLIIAKSDPILTKINAEIEKLKQLKSPWLAHYRLPLEDGAVRYPKDPFYADKMILKSYRKQQDGRPVTRDEHNRDLAEDTGVLYPGCIVEAIIDIYPYDQGTPGITSGLHAVRKVRDGERLGRTVDLSTFLGDPPEQDEVVDFSNPAPSSFL